MPVRAFFAFEDAADDGDSGPGARGRCGKRFGFRGDRQQCDIAAAAGELRFEHVRLGGFPRAQLRLGESEQFRLESPVVHGLVGEIGTAREGEGQEEEKGFHR